MGLSDLRSVAHIEQTTVDDVRGAVVAVDFHNWVYRYMTTVARYNDESTYTTADDIAVPHLLGIAKGLPTLYESGLRPVFVFDGEVLDLKADEMDRREQRKQAVDEELRAAEAAGDEVTARRLRARTQRLTPDRIETSRELLDRLDVPVVDAPADAEAQAAHMARRGTVDYVGTEDYDALLFGAPRTLRKLTSGDDLELMDLEATLSEHGITHQQLVDVAILCGTDYNDGVHGVGPKTALSEISSGETAADVLAAYDESLPELDAVRELFVDPAVSDDVSFEQPDAVDLDGARRYLVDDWEIPAESISTAFGRLERSLPTN